jgi:hypothetical protein
MVGLCSLCVVVSTPPTSTSSCYPDKFSWYSGHFWSRNLLYVALCCIVLKRCLQGFSTIWAAKDLQCPPGHTPYSWQKAGDKTFQELWRAKTPNRAKWRSKAKWSKIELNRFNHLQGIQRYPCSANILYFWCICCDIATAVQAMGGASAPSAPAPNKAVQTKHTKHTSHCKKPTWARTG